MKKIKIVFMVFFLVLTLNNIVALGISPGRITITEKDANKTFYFNILNSEGKAMDVSFSTSGELGQYIILDTTGASFLPSESSKIFSYRLNVDKENLNPGDNKGNIVVTEISDSEVSAVSTPSVISQLVYRVPLAEKAISTDVNIIEFDGNATTFIIPVINEGIKNLQDVHTQVDIYSGDELVDTVQSDSVSIGSLERKEFDLKWYSNLDTGFYNASVSVFYDEDVETLNKQFVGGDLFIGVFDFFVKNFKPGSAVEFNVLVDNRLGDVLDGVYVKLFLSDKNGKEVADVRSASYKVLPGTNSVIPLFLDTSNLSNGDYTGKLVVNYLRFAIEKSVRIKVTDFGIGVDVDAGGFILDKNNSFLNFVGILIILLLLALALRKLKKKK